MLYKASVLMRYNPLIKRVIRKTRKIFGLADPTADINAKLVRKYAPGKFFADIGALWGVDGLNSFIAAESRASRVMAVDIYPASPKFLEENRKRNAKVEFVQGDINLASTVQKIGQADVVLCSGVLYHTPDPIHLLTRLRAITKETLILNTAAIPEMAGLQNVGVFYPFLREKQRNIWKLGSGMQKAITGPYEPEEGYANWFWGMTPSLIESMLNCAGFEVKERYVSSKLAVFVCRTTDLKFIATSGEWNTPGDAVFSKFKS